VTVPPQDRSSDRSGIRTNDRAHDERMTNSPVVLRNRCRTRAEAERRSHATGTIAKRCGGRRSLRRTVHTLKGDAGRVRIREFSELCHEFEDVLALENPAPPPRFPPSRCALPMSFGHAGAYRKARNSPASSLYERRSPIWRTRQTAARQNPKARPGEPSRREHHGRSMSNWQSLRRFSEGKRVHHVVVKSTPSAACPSPPVR